MTRYLVLSFLVWCMLAATSAAADQGEEAKSIEALKKLGGHVWPVDTKAGQRNGMVIFGYKGWVSETDMKEAVGHLRKLPDLCVLSLNFTWVTDAGLAPLKELPELQVLSLKATGVTDAGLTHLQKLPGLRHIDLTLTRVTDKGVAALKKALPHAKVSWSGSGKPAGEAEKLRGTWRGTRILPRNQKEHEQKDVDILIMTGNDLSLDSQAGQFTLNPDSKPKSIDVKITDCLPGLNTPCSHYLGIYRLEGDTLTLCLSPTYGGREERPTKFTAEGFNGFMYIFKREKE